MVVRFFAALFFSSIVLTAHAIGEPSVGPDASQILGGKKGDSCTVIMCLSNPIGQDLAECSDALRKFERMRPEKRPAFLRKCPMVTGGQGND